MTNPIKLADFPLLLQQIYNPPRQLYFRGNPNILKKTLIAIVGTRKFSDYGKHITKQIILDLSILDVAIVSGLAKGIDTIAHREAINNSLPTIAILGNGIDEIYPRQNEALAQEIIKQGGLILSEHGPKTPPRAFHFPLRNRIISGLSIATLVIECPIKSGALITAKYALEQGREIFTVPGDIDLPNSQGPITLLQNGAAYPVRNGREIIEIIQKQPHLFESFQKTNNPLDHLRLSLGEKILLSQLSPTRPRSLELLQKKTDLKAQEFLEALSLLEIQNLVTMRDKKYLRNI
ncbi:DNA-processing protein DprA [Patescibacteria group bacterium]|nr:DNA-processing protein DprA [Patescibacteria group bacterium]